MNPVITSLGMVSSLGFGVVASCAAIRAGLVRPRPLRSIRVLSSDPAEESTLTGHPIEGYTEGFALVGRWIRLALGSLTDLLQYGNLPDVTDSAFWQHTALIAAIPFPDEESLTGRADQDLDILRRAFVLPVLKTSRLPIRPEYTDVLWNGHVGAIAAIARAWRLLEERRVARVLVIASDSYLEEALLQELIEQRRLKAPDVPSGIAPGEAAATFLLESPWSARARQAKVQAVVRAAHAAHNAQFSRTGAQTGGTLSQVVDRALDMAGQSTPLLGDIHTDLNGENWRASQVAYLRVRLASRLSPQCPIRSPCGSLGDVGAASGAVSVCVAARSYQRGYCLTDTSLLLSLSDRGHCGALVLERPRS